MTSRDDPFNKWKETRKKGALRFVLIYGVLFWGVGTAILASLTSWLASGVDLGKQLSVALVIYPVVGLMWGTFMWLYIDRKYRQRASNPPVV